MTGRRVENAGAVIDPAAFGIVRAKNQPADAEQADGMGAHRAWFQRDHQVAIGQARAATCGGGSAQGKDFGMSGWIAIGFRAIARARKNNAPRPQNNGANRDLAPGGGVSGLDKRGLHRVQRHTGVTIVGCVRQGGSV